MNVEIVPNNCIPSQNVSLLPMLLARLRAEVLVHGGFLPSVVVNHSIAFLLSYRNICQSCSAVHHHVGQGIIAVH